MPKQKWYKLLLSRPKCNSCNDKKDAEFERSFTLILRIYFLIFSIQQIEYFLNNFICQGLYG